MGISSKVGPVALYGGWLIPQSSKSRNLTVGFAPHHYACQAHWLKKETKKSSSYFLQLQVTRKKTVFLLCNFIVSGHRRSQDTRQIPGGSLVRASSCLSSSSSLAGPLHQAGPLNLELRPKCYSANVVSLGILLCAPGF